MRKSISDFNRPTLALPLALSMAFWCHFDIQIFVAILKLGNWAKLFAESDANNNIFDSFVVQTDPKTLQIDLCRSVLVDLVN